MLSHFSRLALQPSVKASSQTLQLSRRPCWLKKHSFSSASQLLSQRLSHSRSFAHASHNTQRDFVGARASGVELDFPLQKPGIGRSKTAPSRTPSQDLVPEDSLPDSDLSSVEKEEIQADTSNLQRLHELASQLPTVPSGIIHGHSRHNSPQRLTSEHASALGEIVKLLDSIVTQTTAIGASYSLDLLQVVQAFPDQLGQWATLHLIEPRSRAAQLWGLGVMYSLARLQHPLTIELWDVVKDSDLDLPVTLYIELCYYFGLPPSPKNSTTKTGRYRSLSRAEKATALQDVLRRAKSTGNSLIILTCWNHTIQSLLAKDDIIGAEREWLALQRMGYSPPIELLQAFIRYYSSRASRHPEYVEKVSAFHARIKHLNLSPDLHTYSEIMKCYERSMRYKDMAAVLLEMTQEELKHLDIDSSGEMGVQAIRGIRVKGPRAMQISNTLDLPESDSSSTMTWSTPESASIITVSNVPSSTTDDADSKFDLSAMKARRAAAAAVAASARGDDSPLKVGNTLYNGGAQWAGGGRKHPTKTPVVAKLQASLGITPPSAHDVKSLRDREAEELSRLQRKEDDLVARRNNLVTAWSRAIYSALSLGSLRKAMLLVEEMQMLGLEVNDRICTEFMFYAGKRKNLSLLHTWWSRLRKITGDKLLRKHYLILMREYLRMNKDQEARNVMTEFCEKFGPHDDVYALWLRYYSNRGFNLSVEQTLRQMEVNNVEYGAYSLSALMEMFAKRGNLDEMFSWLERLKKVTQSTHAIDDVVAKCIYHFLEEGHNIGTVTTWLDSLPAAPKYFPRTLAALLVTSGKHQNTHALGQLANLCTNLKSAHILVGLVRGYSLTSASPQRDHTIVDILTNCGAVKFSLSAPQNDEIMQSIMLLPMPTVLLDWVEELIAHPSHVAEPTPALYLHSANASLATNNPERFVELVSKSSDKYGTIPPIATAISVVRSVLSTGDRNRVLYIAAPLLALYPHESKQLLTMLDRELSAIGVHRPKGVPSPSLANPQTLDIASYVSRRLGLSD